jgi:hypothetical protein
VRSNERKVKMSESTAEAIDRIVALRDQGAAMKEVDGVMYTTQDLTPVIYEPKVRALEIESLTSLVSYLSDNLDQLDPSKYLIHVKSPTEVEIVSVVAGKKREREVYLRATLDETVFSAFPFERFLAVEEFQIRLKTQFVQDEAIERLIAFTAKVTNASEVSQNDDGISQQVSVKKGVSGSLSATAPVPAVQVLTPYRTFREINQPQGQFLFRMKERSGVEVALFEADGGRWRIEAVEGIKVYLSEKLPAVKVIE